MSLLAILPLHKHGGVAKDNLVAEFACSLENSQEMKKDKYKDLQAPIGFTPTAL